MFHTWVSQSLKQIDTLRYPVSSRCKPTRRFLTQSIFKNSRLLRVAGRVPNCTEF